MNANNFSIILRKQRQIAGYSQAEMSRKLYLARSTYNHFESGKRIPSIDIILNIASICSINPMILISSVIPDETMCEYSPCSKCINTSQIYYSPSDIKLLSQLNSLSDTEKRTVTSLIELLVNAHTDLR